MTRDPTGDERPWGSDELRALLRHARRDAPEARLAAVAARIGVVGPEAATTHAGPRAADGQPNPTVRRMVPLKIAASVIAAAAVAIPALWLAVRSQPSPARPSLAMRSPLPSSEASPEPSHALVGADKTQASATASPRPGAGVRVAAQANPRLPQRKIAAQAAPGASEVTLLRSAREALARDSREALALADRHAAAFPTGVLAQEREVVAIQALVALGRSAEARVRAQQFLARHPESAHAPKVRQLVGLFDHR